MFLLLAVLSVTCGSICALKPPPPYVETNKEILAAQKEIANNILSMAEKVPHLNDPRRHYAEITHVIYDAAYDFTHSCMLSTYDEIVERAVPEAISHPLKVVETAQKFHDALDKKTDTIQKLIKFISSIGLNDMVTNSLLHIIITTNPEKYKEVTEFHFTIGKAAKEFNKKKNKFEQVSKEMDAHKYVITGTEELKPVILAVSQATKIAYPLTLRC